MGDGQIRKEKSPMNSETKKPESGSTDPKTAIPANPAKVAELDEDDLDKVAGGKGGGKGG